MSRSIYICIQHATLASDGAGLACGGRELGRWPRAWYFVLVICTKIISHVRFDTLISFEDCVQCLTFILKIMTTCLTRLL